MHAVAVCQRYPYTVEAAYYDHFGTRAFDNNNRLITFSGVNNQPPGKPLLTPELHTWGTIIYQYSTIGEFLSLMEMRCVRPLPFLMTGQS